MAKKLNIFEAPLAGISLVEAGAGTGKTYNIASLYIRVILEKRLMPANILVLTFTNAATAELKSRLRQRIKDSIEAFQSGNSDDGFLSELTSRFDSSSIPILKKALYEFDEAEISTIHGFCQQLIRENALTFNISPQFEVLSDDSTLLQDEIDKFWRDFFHPSDSEFRKSIQLFVADEGLTPDKFRDYIQAKIKKNYSVLIPEAIETDELEIHFEEVREAFMRIKKVFDSEKAHLNSLYKSGTMNGNKYRATFPDYIKDFSQWLSSEIVPLKPFDKIHLFSGSSKEWVNKGNTAPNFDFVELVNEYLETVEPFKQLSTSVIRSAIQSVIKNYELEKARLGVLTYDDLLQKVAELVLDQDSDVRGILRAKYPVALIDEFQDTDPIQYSIFKSVYSKSESTALFMIGDPKQAIYSFRGADIHTYIRAKEDAHSDQVYLLEDNYRSNPDMIQAVNKLFSKEKNIFQMEEIEFNPVNFPGSRDPVKAFLFKDSENIPPLQFLSLSPESNLVQDIREAVSESVAAEVAELLSGNYQIDGERVNSSDIAILVDNHSEATEMQRSLLDAGVKSILRSRNSVYKSNESKELYLILSAIAELTFEDHIRAALSTEAIGFTAGEILRVLEDESKWSGIYAHFQKLNKLWRSKGFSVMIEELRHVFSVEKNLAAYENAERRITNVQHIIELLRKADAEYQFAPSALLRYFRNKQSDSSSENDEELVRLESDDDLVQIATIHASKGLEYPIVFCPFLWKGIKTTDEKPFSFYDSGVTYLDLGTEEAKRKEHRFKKIKDDLAEEIRLSYVALTRSKSACFVHFVNGSGSEFSSLSALAEGEKLVQQRLKDKLFNTPGIYKKLHPKESFRLNESINSLYNKDVISIRDGRIKTGRVELFKKKDQPIPPVQIFSRKDLSKFPVITSFSALSGKLTESESTLDEYAFDYDEINESEITSKSVEVLSRFTLPKGAHTGTLLHTIFEEVEFDNPESFSPVVEQQLQRLGFEARWQQTVEKLIEDTVTHNLIDDFQLSGLNFKDYLVEMEFHFPVKNTSGQSLLDSIRNQVAIGSHSSVCGYMKGFIDLIFNHRDKYFILDYKSNYLGDTQEDYAPERLKQEIEHSNYDLQYHIYTLALHRFLGQNVEDYSYEKHFGGVIYLFLRGVNTDKKGSGVFFDKPDLKVIEELNSKMGAS
ncbi:MAG: exodeoxyribonuclease V subunit beta [Balneolaceae bacterium]|nr:exodeoxyribonuclease V subunit beta [Balneolaceae bacterium]MBO6546143.1 exodeoxyribonuclease V subunit beta [Balneolaceae bacterium]MBO6648501.1 exodeoxyribonuclease V subunit beta [Balneolaceae bacterium]